MRSRNKGGHKSPFVCPHGRRPYPVRDEEDGTWVLVGCQECYQDLMLRDPRFLPADEWGEWLLPDEEE